MTRAGQRRVVNSCGRIPKAIGQKKGAAPEGGP